MKQLLLILSLFSCLALRAQSPSVDPRGLFVLVGGEETDDASTGQNAPLEAHFTANPSDLGDYTARYEWKIWEADDPATVLVHRFEENMDYTFTRSGTFMVQLYATFSFETDTISVPELGDENPIVVSISESKLEMPNAFSPNGDGFNDVYRVKSGYQSIVDFKATIFNRWGQKIYSWTDLEGGWDGTWHGRTVRDGVYFVVVDARGADGRHYKIRRDVNVLTGYENDNYTSDDE